MTVVMTISKAPNGTDADDALNGGDLGADMGQTIRGSYTPLVLQSANTGSEELWYSHDAAVDPITSVGFYIDPFSGTYGGADSAAGDFSSISALGAADAGTTKNNTDFGGGLSRGLHMDMSWDVSDANQFLYSRETSGQKRIFGKSYSGLTGLSLLTAFPLHVDACSYWNGTAELDATVPVTGKIGKSTDTVLGNRAHMRWRFYLHQAAVDGGILQFDRVTKFSFTG